MILLRRIVAALVLICGMNERVRAETPDSRGGEFFEQHIRPLLVNHCYECHSAKADEVGGDLFLDRRSGWRKGGDSGPAIVPGDPDKSLLISAIGYANSDLQMPPTDRLAKRDIDRLTQWVKMGAPDPRDGALSTRPNKKKKTIDIEAGRKFWAFQTPTMPAVPKVKNTIWPQSPLAQNVVVNSKGWYRVSKVADFWRYGRPSIGRPPSDRNGLR